LKILDEYRLFTVRSLRYRLELIIDDMNIEDTVIELKFATLATKLLKSPKVVWRLDTVKNCVKIDDILAVVDEMYLVLRVLIDAVCDEMWSVVKVETYPVRDDKRSVVRVEIYPVREDKLSVVKVETYPVREDKLSVVKVEIYPVREDISNALIVDMLALPTLMYEWLSPTIPDLIYGICSHTFD